jgi:hypothetical protein
MKGINADLDKLKKYAKEERQGKDFLGISLVFCQIAGLNIISDLKEGLGVESQQTPIANSGVYCCLTDPTIHETYVVQ